MHPDRDFLISVVSKAVPKIKQIFRDLLRILELLYHAVIFCNTAIGHSGRLQILIGA